MCPIKDGMVTENAVCPCRIRIGAGRCDHASSVLARSVEQVRQDAASAASWPLPVSLDRIDCCYPASSSSVPFHVSSYALRRDSMVRTNHWDAAEDCRARGLVETDSVGMISSSKASILYLRAGWQRVVAAEVATSDHWESFRLTLTPRHCSNADVCVSASECEHDCEFHCLQRDLTKTAE